MAVNHTVIDHLDRAEAALDALIDGHWREITTEMLLDIAEARSKIVVARLEWARHLERQPVEEREGA